jgi:hypothetical protein
MKTKTAAKAKSSKKGATLAPAAVPQTGYSPSAKEVENGRKVLAILQDIDDIGYTVHRPDLFSVTEPELGLEIMVDAEEEVVCLVADICDIAHLEKHVPDWSYKLLELNNKLLHGAFALDKGHIWLRENLAAANLDPNELEDALSAMFTGIMRYAHVLKLLR